MKSIEFSAEAGILRLVGSGNGLSSSHAVGRVLPQPGAIYRPDLVRLAPPTARHIPVHVRPPATVTMLTVITQPDAPLPFVPWSRTPSFLSFVPSVVSALCAPPTPGPGRMDVAPSCCPRGAACESALPQSADFVHVGVGRRWRAHISRCCARDARQHDRSVCPIRHWRCDSHDWRNNYCALAGCTVCTPH